MVISITIQIKKELHGVGNKAMHKQCKDKEPFIPMPTTMNGNQATEITIHLNRMQTTGSILAIDIAVAPVNDGIFSINLNHSCHCE